MNGLKLDWSHFLPRAFLVAALTGLIAFGLSWILAPVNQFLGTTFGGALFLLLELVLFLWVLSVHPGKEDFSQLVVMVTVATVALKLVGSFVQLPILSYNFDFTGGLGVWLVSLSTVLLADTVAMMAMRTKRPITG